MPGIWTKDARRKARERGFAYRNASVIAEPHRFSRLKRQRVAQRITQPELAQAADLALSSYRDIENRYTKPRQGSLLKIAKALGVEAAEIDERLHSA